MSSQTAAAISTPWAMWACQFLGLEAESLGLFKDDLPAKQSRMAEQAEKLSGLLVLADILAHTGTDESAPAGQAS